MNPLTTRTAPLSATTNHEDCKFRPNGHWKPFVASSHKTRADRFLTLRTATTLTGEKNVFLSVSDATGHVTPPLLRCVCVLLLLGPFFSPTSPYHPHILHSTILLTTFERLKNEFGLKHSRIVESRTTRHSSMDFGRRDEGTFGRAKIKQKPEKHENYLVGAFSPRRSLFSLLLYCVFPNSLFYEMAALHARHI